MFLLFCNIFLYFISYVNLKQCIFYLNVLILEWFFSLLLFMNYYDNNKRPELKWHQVFTISINYSNFNLGSGEPCGYSSLERASRTLTRPS